MRSQSSLWINLRGANPHIKVRVFPVKIFVTLFLLSGCVYPATQPAGYQPPREKEYQASETSELELVEPEIPIEPQPFETQAAVGQIEPGGNPQQPIRFVFPTQAPPPKSAWRPPLYPVPWALRDFDHFYFVRPIPVDDINWPLANYRYGGIFFEDVVHTGVDIPGPLETPVLAAGPGKVVWSGYGLMSFTPDNFDDPYGLAIAIKHDFGYNDRPLYTLYAHLSESFVVDNQHVEAGEVIGLTGDSGVTTGPHLHFEVRVGSNSYYATRNPELWLSPPQGWGILAGRVMSSSGALLERKEVVVTSVDTYQVWLVMTYGPKSVNSDPYYQENVVMGDLPAGRYQVDIQYEDEKQSQIIEIVPGTVTYFTFKGQDGFSTELPATPTVDSALSTP